jgi:hypothetical protein
MSLSSMQSESVFDSDDEDFSVPMERDWKLDVHNLKMRTGEFNINNYVHILSEEEKESYKKVIAKIPPENRVYIQ